MSRHTLSTRIVALLLSWTMPGSSTWALSPAPAEPPRSVAPVATATDVVPGGLLPSTRASEPVDTTSVQELPEPATKVGSSGRAESGPDSCGAPVRPILECVEDLGGGQYRAHFGYSSENPAAISIPVGGGNKFTPAPQDRGQPTVFVPGRTPAYPDAAFDVDFGGQNLVWTLKGPDGSSRTATASSGSNRCAAPAPACASSIFGPQRFDRTAGPPNVYDVTVTVPPAAQAPLTLRLTNGSPDGKDRVSSAEVRVDGAVVVGPSDLNQNTGFVWKTVSLQRPQSALRVRLASAPGSYLTLEICGESGGGDTTPPQVAVAEPAPASFVASSTPTVRVAYSDDRALDLASLRILVGGVDRTALFSVGPAEAVATLPASAALPDGPASVTASISDQAGHPASARSDFTVDSQPPQVTILEPGNGEWVRETQVDVNGEAVDANLVGVTVAGLPARVEYSSFVAQGVPVGAGPEVTLEAAATDAAGHVGRATVTLRVDRVAPALTITSPAAGAIVRGPQVRVTGQAADAAPFTVTVNGQSALVAGGQFEASVLAGDGPLHVQAEARDAAGNTTSAETDVTVDGQAPLIALAQPAPGTVTRAASVNVAGSVTDGSDVTLHVDGAAVPVAGGQFSTDVALPDEGPRTIAIVAVDAVGNAAQSSVALVVDRTPPALSVASPPEGALLGAEPVLLAGTVQDATAVTVGVDGQAATINGLAWSLQRSGLSEGENLVVVTATDAAGNPSTVERRFLLDQLAPSVSISEPSDGSLTREAQATVRGTAEDAQLASVEVNGVVATLGTGSGPRPWVAASVPLAEGDNTLVALARDSLGRAGQRQVLVTRDSTPPQVALQAPERIVAGVPVTAQATASDERALDRVAFSLQGQVIATLAAPPFEVQVAVPAGAEPGETLLLEAEAFDTAGNSGRAARGLRVVADGVVTGQVLSDRTGLPLEGASVRLLGSAAAPEATDDRGRYSFHAVDATATLQAEKDGLTRVERSVRLASGSGVVPVDARLTPLAEPVAVGPGGGLLGADLTRPLGAPAGAPPARVEVEVPAGALVGTEELRLTVLTPQGLPALLPLGWSPIVALRLDPEGLTWNASPVLRVTGLPQGALALAELRPALHAWVARQAGLAADADGALVTLLPGTGDFALVSADQGPQAPAPPVVGEPLGGVQVREIPAAAASDGTVVPPTLPPGGGTARGRALVTSPEPLPSGTVVQTEVEEFYELSGGPPASTEKRRQDLLLYRGTLQALESPAGGVPTLEGELPLTPSRSYSTAELVRGRVHLDVLSGREDVRGTAGGNQAVVVASGPARLSIPAGALPENTAVTLESVPLSGYLPSSPDWQPFGEVLVDLAGRTLALPAELQHDATGVAPGGAYVLARVERVAGVPRVAGVAWAVRSGDVVTTTPGPGLAGLRSGGRHVFYRLSSEAGVVGGLTRAAGAPVAAVVSSDRLPFVALAGADGAYALLAAAGPATVTGRVPGTPLARSVDVQVAAGQATAQDLELLPAATALTVSPADGAVGVAVNAQVQLLASAPLDPGSLPDLSAVLATVGATETLALRPVLSASGRTLSLLADGGLAHSTTYELQVSGLRDAQGEPVPVPAARFTTRADTPPTYDFSLLAFSYPENGWVTVEAPPGTFAPLSEISILNTANGDPTVLQAGNDGELAPFQIRASVSDRLLVTVTDPQGNTFAFERSEYVAPDGTTGIGPAGGTVRGAGGYEIRVPDGAVAQGVTLRIEPLGPDAIPPEEFPALGLDDQGQPLARFGAAMRVTSPDDAVRAFAKEAALAFPKPADAPDGAFYFVLQKVERADGAVFYLTVDQASVQGDKVVTASPPFEGYVAHMAGLSATGALAVAPVSSAISILMWTYDQIAPGRARLGVVTGRVYQAAWTDPGSQPSYTPVAGVTVARADGLGVPEVGNPGARLAHFAITGKDGVFTFWDDRYSGGPQSVAAIQGTKIQSAVAHEVVNPEALPPLLRFYPHVAEGNITFPAEEAPPAPVGFTLQLFRIVERPDPQNPNGPPLRERVEADGVVELGQPYVVGVQLVAEPVPGQSPPTLEIGGLPQPVSADTWPEVAQRVHYATAEQVPGAVGPLTIEATLLPPFGQPIRKSTTILVLGAGGSSVPVEGRPKVISARTSPVDGAGEVSVSVTPQVVFSEPVTNVRAGVRLLKVGPNGEEEPVEVRLFGIGFEDNDPTLAARPLTDAEIGPATKITALTLRPTQALAFGSPFRLRVGSPIVDIDVDAQGNPTPQPVEPYVSGFATAEPMTTPPPGGDQPNSPGLAVIGNRAYLATSQYLLNTVLYQYDITDALLPDLLRGRPSWAPRPVDLLGFSRQAPFESNERVVVVATGPGARSKPSSLLVLDASRDFDPVTPLPILAAATVAGSAADGFISRVAYFDGRLYSATSRKGLQVVDLRLAADAVGSQADQNEILRLINTDGAGFGGQAVVNTLPLRSRSNPQRAGLYADLDVDAFEVDGQSLALVAVTGEKPLWVVDPSGSTAGSPEPPEPQGVLKTLLEIADPAQGTPELRSGAAVAFARAGSSRLVLVAGAGVVNGAARDLLAVLDMATPTSPQVLRVLDLGPSGGPEDIAVRGDLAVVGRRTGGAVFVSLTSPSQPQVLGVVEGIGSRLAWGEEGELFSTQFAPYGGTSSDGGLRTTQIDASARLLDLKTRRLVLPQELDEQGHAKAYKDGHVVFTLGRQARVTWRVEGQPRAARLDADESAAPIEGRELPRGIHFIHVPGNSLGLERVDKGFELRAEAVTPGVEPAAAAGRILTDLVNREYRPVGSHVTPDGVSVSSGYLLRSYSDFELDTLQFPLTMTRSYSSSGLGEDSPLGAGWSFPFGGRIEQLAPVQAGGKPRFALTLANGDKSVFDLQGEPGSETLKAPAGRFEKLERQPIEGGTPQRPRYRFTYTTLGGRQRVFEELTTVYGEPGVFLLRSEGEPHGVKLLYSYDARGRLSEVRHSHALGPRLVFRYQKFAEFYRVVQVDSPTTRHVVNYEYDEQGNLARVVRSGANLPGQPAAPAQVWKYDYLPSQGGDAHLLWRVTDPNGNVEEVLYGQPQAGQAPWNETVVKEIHRTGSDGVDEATTFGFDFAQRKTTVASPRGVNTVYVYNEHGNVTSLTEAAGTDDERRTTIEWYEETQRKKAEIDHLNRRTSYGYDARGNRNRESVENLPAPLGTVQQTWTYDERFNQLTSHVDAEGRETVQVVDGKGDVTSRVVKQGGEQVRPSWVYGYAPDSGALVREVDPRGVETKYEETGTNPFGLPKRVVREAGGDEVRDYDERGRLTLQQSPQASRKLVYDGQDRVRYEWPCWACLGQGEGLPEPRVARTYHPMGQLQSEANAAGLTVLYDLDGRNRVAKVRKTLAGGDPLESERKYDGHGNLRWEKTARGVERELQYDGLDRLKKLTVSYGGRAFVPEQHEYDPIRRLADVDLFGSRTEYRYDGLYRVTRKLLPETNEAGSPYFEDYEYDKVGNRTLVRDATGHVTKAHYDALDRVDWVRNAKDQITNFDYADDSRTGSLTEPASEVDPTRGVTRTRTFDALGRRVTETVELTKAPAAAYRTSWTYALAGDGSGETLTELRTGEGPDITTVTARQVLDRGRLRSRTLAPDTQQAQTTQYFYDSLGEVREERRPEGRFTRVYRDGLGRVVEGEDALGRRTHSDYVSDEGLVDSRTDRRGALTKYEYDGLGRLLSETVQGGTPSSTWNYWAASSQDWSRGTRYEDALRQEIVRDANGIETTTTFDRLHRPRLVQYPIDGQEVITWDGVDKRSFTDRKGNRTEFTYDALHRLATTKNAENETVSTDYRDGDLTEVVTDGNQIPTTRRLDGLGRVVSVVREEIELEANRWDNLGNKVEATDAGASDVRHRTRFKYDAANRLSERVDGFESGAEQSTKYEYDLNGNLIKEIDPRSTPAQPSRQYGYDVLDRRISEKDGAGVEWTMGYDPEGNLTRRTEPSQRDTLFYFDEIGKLTKVVQPQVAAGVPTTWYAYDKNRNLRFRHDARGNTTESQYDLLNREKDRIQYSTGQQGNLAWHFDYYPDDTVEKVTDPKGQVVTSTYDQARRPRTWSLAPASGGGYVPWRYTSQVDFEEFDDNGNLKKVKESVSGDGLAGTETFLTQMGYDRLDRLRSVSVTLPDAGERTVEYAYWPNGSRREVKTLGNTTTYDYDALGRLWKATTPHGATVYGYWPDSLLKKVTRPNGVTTELTYDLADRVDTVETKAGAALLTLYDYDYFENGNRHRQAEYVAGRWEETNYTYDRLNRLETVRYPADPANPSGRLVTYTYDLVGNRVGEAVTRIGDNTILSSRTGSFDDLNRLGRLVDHLDPTRTVAFDYDRNGNLARQTTNPDDPQNNVASSFRYDLKDQLVEVLRMVTTPGPPASDGQPPSPPVVTTMVLARFQNDWQGRRVKKVGDDGVLDYLYDGDSILAEFSELGTEVARYEWGGDSLLSVVRSSEGRRYFHVDGLGSVTTQTDEAGSAVASFRWDAWGNPRFPEDLQGQKNRLGFTGHYFDTETQLYYAKARYFDPELGRFLSQDSYLGELTEPPSLHRYLYAWDRPTYWADSTGHCPGCGWDEIAQEYSDRVLGATAAMASDFLPLSPPSEWNEASAEGIEYGHKLATNIAILETLYGAQTAISGFGTGAGATLALVVPGYGEVAAARAFPVAATKIIVGGAAVVHGGWAMSKAQAQLKRPGGSRKSVENRPAKVKSDPSSAANAQQEPEAGAGAREARLRDSQREGARRELETHEELKAEHPDASVQRERYLRDEQGRRVPDPLTGETRRVDHVVIEEREVIRSVETTSRTADKAAQVAKEQRIRQAGGNYVRNKETREIVPFRDGVRTEVRRRD